jgi:protein TonB
MQVACGRIALLESERHGDKPGSGSLASVTLHAALLGLAITATAHSGIGVKHDTTIYIPLPRLRPQVQMISHPATRPAPVAPPRVPAISVAVPTVIPTGIPAPDVSPVIPTTIGAPTVAVHGSNTRADSAVTSIRGDAPLTDDQVDVAAAALAGQRGPVYPEGLRVVGVEGRVMARFIIEKNGRVESEPTILSATADEFASSVRRYLSIARYRPALKNGEPVRQLAEQEFMFTIRR